MKLVKGAAGLVAGVTVAAASWTTYMLTRRGVTTSVDSAFFYTPFELGIPYETVSFHNSEGLRLKGWWLESTDTGKVLILCPGYGRSKSDLLGLGSRLWKAGYRVLMFDFRDQGESERAVATIGHYETDDLHAAIDYVSWRVPGAEIGLVGYSMGAAASIIVGASRPEVRAVVADSPFADLHPVLRSMFKALTRMPPRPSLDLAEVLIWLKAGYRISKVRPIDYVSLIAPRPLFIIHGDRDGLTPISDAYALYDAAGEPKELWVVEGCGHCGAYFQDRQLYINRVLDFVARRFGVPEQASGELVPALIGEQ